MGKVQGKRNIIAIVLIVAFVLIGGTIAVHTSRGVLRNIFHLGYWQNETKEDFVSPDGWVPCDETPKTVIAKNTGSVNAVVRIKFDEYWKRANSTSTDQTTELPLTDSLNNKLASVNLQNQEDWEDGGDGWYYYRYTLQPGQETNSLLKSVSFSCESNFTGVNAVCTEENGTKTCTKPDNDYDGSKFHVYVTVQYLEADGCDNIWGHCAEPPYVTDCNSNILYDTIACQTKGIDTNIDYTEVAAWPDYNGLGVNTFAPKAYENFPVYYYRGEVSNNNVIWANYCWKIIRTTTTGGVKLLYAGTPSNGECYVYDSDLRISTGNGRFNENSNEVGSAGYMYGATVVQRSRGVYSDTPPFTFSSSVTRNGNQYTLNTNSGEYVSGKWNIVMYNAATRYHYFCSDGSIVCDSTKIGYIFNFSKYSEIYYLPLGGYDNIEQLKEAVFANEHDSTAKANIESWFETSGLSAREGDLEDTVFCNDRTIVTGALAGEEVNSLTSDNKHINSSFAPFIRNSVENAAGNYSPSLDCPNKNDAFTKDDTKNGNGMLNHKVGLLTADEATLASAGWELTTENYVYSYIARPTTWTMSPADYKDYGYIWNFEVPYIARSNPVNANYYRPVVSLKRGTTYVTGGTGTGSNPYVIEQQ